MKQKKYLQSVYGQKELTGFLLTSTFIICDSFYMSHTLRHILIGW